MLSSIILRRKDEENQQTWPCSDFPFISAVLVFTPNLLHNVLHLSQSHAQYNCEEH